MISTAANLFGRMVSRWRWWYAPIGLLSIFVLSCVLVWWFQNIRLERRYAEIRAAGYPVSLEELNEYYALPEGVEDNTALWLEALRLVETSSSDVDLENLPIVGYVEEIPPVGQPWPEKEFVEEYLNDHAEALLAIHTAAAAGGGVRYPHDFEEYFWGMDLQIISLRQCGRLMSLKAHFRANHGDIAGAAESLRAALAVGKSLERDPVVVEFLVRVALDGIAIANTSQLLNQIEFSDSDLRSFQSALRSTNYAEDLHCCMVGDRTSYFHAYDDLQGLGFDPVPAKILSIAVPGAKARHAEVTADMIEATKLPLHEALAFAKGKTNWEPSELSISDYLVHQSYSAPNIWVEAGARAEAHALTLDAAIAAELFRREHGSFPTTIDELVPTYIPSVPIDPFDGKPIRYLLDDDGLVVYSIGWDYVDHGGVLERKDEQGNPEYLNIDIGVRLDTDAKAENTSPDE